MASWQAHAAAWFLKRRFKPRLWAAADIAELRGVLRGPPSQRLPAEVKILPRKLGGIAGEWVTSPKTNGLKLLYLHGGGYCSCSAETHRPVTCFFAKLGFKVFAPDYRLAPEHVFPAAVEDAAEAFRGLAETEEGENVIAGDSAGGGLAAATMLMLRDASCCHLPAGAALFSPWVDLAATGESLKTNDAKCAIFHGAKIAEYAKQYLGNADPRTPLASPLYADLSGLPPILIHVGKNEILLDDSLRFAERAEQAGVNVTLKVWPVVPHAWQLTPRFIPEGRQSLREAASFLAKAAADKQAALNTSPS